MCNFTPKQLRRIIVCCISLQHFFVANKEMLQQRNVYLFETEQNIRGSCYGEEDLGQYTYSTFATYMAWYI